MPDAISGNRGAVAVMAHASSTSAPAASVAKVAKGIRCLFIDGLTASRAHQVANATIGSTRAALRAGM